GISDKISLFKDAYLSSSTFSTGGYSATIHSLSPFHLSGCKVACKAPRLHGRNGPFSSSIIPIERTPPLPPFDGLPSFADLQNASTAPDVLSCSALSFPTEWSMTAFKYSFDDSP